MVEGKQGWLVRSSRGFVVGTRQPPVHSSVVVGVWAGGGGRAANCVARPSRWLGWRAGACLLGLATEVLSAEAASEQPLQSIEVRRLQGDRCDLTTLGH